MGLEGKRGKTKKGGERSFFLVAAGGGVCTRVCSGMHGADSAMQMHAQFGRYTPGANLDGRYSVSEV